MATVMKDLLTHTESLEQIPDILREVGMDESCAQHFEACVESIDLPRCLGEDLDPIASTLERLAVEPRHDINGVDLMDLATALRLYGPENVRRGKPLEWSEKHGFPFAVDENETSWSIHSGAFGVGLIIADWDRPDWYVDTVEEAKLLAAEIVVRPKFKREHMEEFGIVELPDD